GHDPSAAEVNLKMPATRNRADPYRAARSHGRDQISPKWALMRYGHAHTGRAVWSTNTSSRRRSYDRRWPFSGAGNRHYDGYFHGPERRRPEAAAADSGRLFWITQILRKNSTDEVTLTWHFLEWRRQN